MGRTRVRVRTYAAHCARTNERMARSPCLSLSHSLLGLRAFKLDRVQVRPMADVAKLPCDSGFTLSRAPSVAAIPFRPVPLLSASKRKCGREKTGKLRDASGVVRRVQLSSRDGMNKPDSTPGKF